MESLMHVLLIAPLFATFGLYLAWKDVRSRVILAMFFVWAFVTFFCFCRYNRPDRGQLAEQKDLSDQVIWTVAMQGSDEGELVAIVRDEHKTRRAVRLDQIAPEHFRVQSKGWWWWRRHVSLVAVHEDEHGH